MSGIQVAFFGTLGRDAEQKTAKSGKPYVRFAVRVGDGDGAQWVSVTCFDNETIENAAAFVKGSRVYAEGNLTLNEWTAADGARRQGLACLSFHTRLAAIGKNAPKREREREAPKDKAAAPSRTNDFHDDTIPF